jgi:nitrous oxide reductase accessory protein NosL
MSPSSTPRAAILRATLATALLAGCNKTADHTATGPDATAQAATPGNATPNAGTPGSTTLPPK